MLTTYNANIPTDMRTSWSKQFLQPTFPSYWEECADILIMVNCAYADGCTTKEEYLSRLVSFYNKAGKPKLVILEVIDASYTCEDLDFPVCIRLNPQDVESMFPMSKISSYLTYKYPKNKRTKRLYVIEKR